MTASQCALLVLLFLFLILALCFPKPIGKTRLKTHAHTKYVVSMTTIPERLRNPWFRHALKKLVENIDAHAGSKLVLWTPLRTTGGEAYVVPANVARMQSARFEIHNVDVDEGPITKLVPALRCPEIADDEIIVVCDDDIVYKKGVFDMLARSVANSPDAVSCMCNATIEGYKAFAFMKRVLKDVARISIPRECFRIDDSVLQWFVNSRGIATIAVPYHGDACWFCSFDKSETDTHPKWTELVHDDRKRIARQCRSRLSSEVAGQSHSRADDRNLKRSS